MYIAIQAYFVVVGSQKRNKRVDVDWIKDCPGPCLENKRSVPNIGP